VKFCEVLIDIRIFPPTFEYLLIPEFQIISPQISPVFTQFLDSTWQLMQQRPDSFEFNERFLLILHDHVMSCQFGTFVGNCEKDRVDLKLSEKTFSLWGYMANHMNEYINPLFRPGETSDDIIRPNLSPQVIKFWRGMYSRFESGVHPRENVGELLLTSKEHSASLEDHVQHLTKV
jgi:myotubularin-related protein 6/7/8